MLIFLIITYIFLHQFVNRKFVDGYVGKRYGIYNLVLATSSLIAFFAIKIYEEEGGLGSVFLFLTFLLVYNLVFVGLKAKWTFRLKSPSQFSDSYLIYGTGKMSRRILSLLVDEENVNILGYVSPNTKDTHKFLNNVKCVCNINTLESYVKKRACHIIVPIDHISGEDRSRLVDIARNSNMRFIPLKTGFDIDLNSLQPQKIPELTPDDILTPKSGHFNKIDKEKFKDKVILVVGGAGSIGSSIVEQLLKMDTKKIVCYDISEVSIYRMSERLKETITNLDKCVEFRIGCIGDVNNVSEIIDQGVDIVINAAAYKHVPICEQNINACILNNVIKTNTLLQLVCDKKVDLFIQISTDKAVRPTNVMGVSKRIAELLIIHYQSISKHTKFHVVRFGNVLGSSGSVFHLFVDQIKRGGPITVTHPDITRYLMTIEDAAKLVLKSVSINQKFSINFLDMGQPVKISELADRMIVAHGRIVVDNLKTQESNLTISKVFIGLRPGEKLYEELSHENDATKTEIDGVLAIKVKPENSVAIDKITTTIDKFITQSHADKKKLLLKEIVPDYSPE